MIGRLKFDIDNLVNEILDQIPQDLLIDGLVLDPAIGGGQFVKEVERRKRQAGKTDAEIAATVFGIEQNLLRKDYAVNKHQLVGNYTVGNFLEKDFKDMKFDVVVGNPPFQKSDSDAARWVLWIEFIKKAKLLSNRVAMITPQSVTSPGPINLIKDCCETLNIDVSKHFDVGSTFSYFVLNTENPPASTRIITDQETFDQDISKVPFLPMTITEDTLKQLDFLVNRKSRIWSRGELHTSKTSLFKPKGRYKVMHTNAQVLETDWEHDNRNKIRVAVSLSGYPKFCVLQNQYVSQACFWTEFDTVENAQAFADECNSAEIQSILQIFKWSGWNSKEVIQCL